jgi:thymidylate kinase
MKLTKEGDILINNENIDLNIFDFLNYMLTANKIIPDNIKPNLAYIIKFTPDALIKNKHARNLKQFQTSSSLSKVEPVAKKRKREKEWVEY